MTRREFPKRIKLAAFKRAGGRCENCTAKLMPGKIRYNHRLPDALGGEPTLENCEVLCVSCDAPITYRRDIPMIAKADRLHAKHSGAKPKKQPWSKYRKLMSGKVVLREEER